jgi:hypothetical protein
MQRFWQLMSLFGIENWNFFNVGKKLENFFKTSRKCCNFFQILFWEFFQPTLGKFSVKILTIDHLQSAKGQLY